MIELIIILICFLTFGILTYSRNLNSNQSTVAEFSTGDLIQNDNLSDKYVKVGESLASIVSESGINPIAISNLIEGLSGVENENDTIIDALANNLAMGIDSIFLN